ncbi:hypothetical protein FACS189459_7170 [Bacilli bacterium]|nr:hypothetical protein FACS189459_7170 [Bacilli bacterium]
MMLGQLMSMAFLRIMFLMMFLPMGISSGKRINEVLKEKQFIYFPEKTSEDFTSTGSIEFKNVCFKYENAEKNVLSDLNFKVNKGETFSFIGRTGSGKTTIINLLARLYETTQGEILIDGVNIKNISNDDLCKKIAIVPQKAFLFNTSILNIKE